MSRKRLLVVDDEPDLIVIMSGLLRGFCRQRNVEEPEIHSVHNTHDADLALSHSYWHLVSMDLILPTAAGRQVESRNGVEMVRRAAKSGGLMSKLISYSALLGDIDNRPKELTRASTQLPKIDLYAKSSMAVSEGGDEPIEPLTPGGWANRVLDYLFTDDRYIDAEDYAGGSRRLSAVGCWLQQAPRHLPTILARHATVLDSFWEDTGTQRIDAALQFIEAGTRLAVAQTCALIEHSGGRVQTIPDGANMDQCLKYLGELMDQEAHLLKPWTWRSYARPAIPALDQARLLRNQLRHALTPINARHAWSQLRPSLQAMMDLSGYWAQHPIWTELRNSNRQWTGERLAGNQWPRPRREVGANLEFDATALRGGAWQSAVRWAPGGKGPVAVETFQWSTRWLRPDSNGRAWHIPLYRRSSRTQRHEWVTMDIDGGELGARPAE